MEHRREKQRPVPVLSVTGNEWVRIRDATVAYTIHTNEYKIEHTFPVPGGPSNSNPVGALAPTKLYFSGFRKESTNSSTASLASPIPSMSSKDVLVDFVERSLLATACLPLPPFPWRVKEEKAPCWYM